MKSFSFKSNKSTLRVLKEPVIKKKRMSFDRALYLIIIAISIFLLLRYIITKVTIIDANGQVLMDKVNVNFTHDIRLLEFNVIEGDTINKQQQLFTYVEDQFDNDGLAYFSSQELLQNNAKKELELKFKIKSQLIYINALKEEISFLNAKEEEITNLVLLDVYTINQLNDIRVKINAEKNRLLVLNNELALLYQQLKSINDLKTLQGGYHETNTIVNSTYFAPIKGVIGQITVNEQETCYRTKNVLTIHNPEEIFIKAYFNLNDIKNVNVNEEVIIQFPDKTKSIGIINKYYVSTYALPEEFQKTYEPTERSIVAEIVPLNKTEAETWSRYHKLSVTIHKHKYSFFSL